MGLYESLAAIHQADSPTVIDWDAAASAAIASTPRGHLDLTDTTNQAYRDAVIEARDGIDRTVGEEVTLPDNIEVVDRHHWIDAAASSFDRMLTPSLPDIEADSVSQTLNTGTSAFTLAFLSRRVIGQYDPALFGDVSDTALYVVHPNVGTVAEDLEADVELFRRWIMHHEVSHAAEFDLAPWLRQLLEDRLATVLSGLPRGKIDRSALGDLHRTMTVIEGFAELLMDESLDEDVTALRERLEARRAGMGPMQQVIEWLLGITAKRQQYSRGREFFIAIADARGMDATLSVWSDPSSFPTTAELSDPTLWLERIDP